ncbi:MAG TPA: hypothetical protein DCQ83_08985 [Fibrobacteres bacterium]|nr:hypothetical protein [Fibrobacterota bacterium]
MGVSEQHSTGVPGHSGALKKALADFMTAAETLEATLNSLSIGEMNPEAYQALGNALEKPLQHLHGTYDRYVAAALKEDGKNITCKKGCSACCRHYVSSVEPFEILGIHLRIRHAENYPDILFASHDRVTRFDKIFKEEQGKGEASEAKDRSLYRYFVRGLACPFLGKDGECGIYESRPMSCRMFFSETSPRFCAGTSLASPWNRNFQVELPDEAEEALARCSALLAGLEIPAELFAGVLEANALFGKYDV